MPKILIQIILFIFLGSSGCSSQTTGRPPNVIIFYADDLGWTDVGFQGSDFYETPRLDQLARESVIFTNAYANAANCAPSRACLMTGLYTPRHGIYTVGKSARGQSENRRLVPVENKVTLDSRFLTIPIKLKEAGYATCIAGKWHLSSDPKDYGFDVNFGGYQAGHPKSYFSPYSNPNLRDGPTGEHLTSRLANEASNWIAARSGEPFFLYFPFYAVHTPIQGRPDLITKYQRKSKGKVHDHATYAAMIESMDQAIGQVLDELKNQKIEEETIIIFTSDNGPHGVVSVADPLRGAKGMYYEGGIRVSLLIKWNEADREVKTLDVPVIGSDLFPTLMELIGSDTPTGLDGLSLVPLLLGNSIQERALFWHSPVYLQMNERNRAKSEAHDGPYWRSTPCSVIRKGDWKLIEYFETGDIELFNLKEDISETENLAAREKQKTQEIFNELVVWRNQTNAPVPTIHNPEYRND
jgi:arylsulfatase A-like enzyme